MLNKKSKKAPKKNPRVLFLGNIPNEIIKSAKQILAKRKSSLESYIKIQLYALVKIKDNSILHLNSKMPFGKFTGLTVEEIVKNDPNYMNWILNNQKTNRFDVTVIELVEQLTSPT